jgi:CubicO group peptidase (beta-lactamase class C family)
MEPGNDTTRPVSTDGSPARASAVRRRCREGRSAVRRLAGPLAAVALLSGGCGHSGSPQAAGGGAESQESTQPLLSRGDSMEIASLAAGQAAGLMCSAHFLGGRSPEAIRREEMDELALALPALYPRETRIEPATRSAVSVSHYGAERRAAYREGLGCVLMRPGAGAGEIASLPEAPLAPPGGDPARIPWPDGDLVADEPLPAGIDREELARAVELAFTGEKYQPSHTIGVVVVHRGRIIAERYAPGWGIHVQNRSFSSAKSVTSALVGILVGQGLLAVDSPAPIPEWRGNGDPRRRITLANLLHMSSGLESDGGGGALLSPTNYAYWGGIDVGAALVSTPPETEPGTRWQYSNFDTMLLMRAAREVIGDDREYLAFPRRALFHRIGMRDSYLETDPHGNFIGSSQLQTTARDLARFGLLYLNDGVWNGKRILPAGWVEFSVRPAPAHPAEAGAPGYGAQWWLFNSDPRLPTDAYSARGARGQFSTVVPSLDLVVVRRGLDRWSANNWSQEEFVADVIKAIRPGKASG